ncbi:arylsulfatase A-like enzyme [Arenibacter sp. ARW7G5Y1]|nr:arylsulfatase A-like enzyme [Arenibacter sp. ARW7G5Y1]
MLRQSNIEACTNLNMAYRFLHKSSNLYLFFLLLIVPLIVVAQTDKQPNIVLFYVDDLGWADVGCYGSTFYETPNIDALAKSGVRFTDAYAACHVCSPSRASLLSGKYPATINLTDWLPGRRNFPFQRFLNVDINQQLPYEETTIAETLKSIGYKTAIIGKWHLGDDPSNPMAHGFDSHIPDWPKGWPGPGGYIAPFSLKGLEDAKEGSYLTDILTDKALKYIESNKENPFFLYMSHYAVHDPIQGRKDLVSKYENKLLKAEASPSADYILEGNPDNPNNPTREELELLIKTEDYKPYKVLPNETVKVKQKQDNVEFAGMVESMDESLGRIMKKLEALNIADNTIIIFYSDNGGMSAANVGNPKRIVPEEKQDKAYSTSNLPLRGAKGWLYEGGIRVPLIIKWPKKGKQGTVSSMPVAAVDIFPTILDMVGSSKSVPKDKEGVDISPVLRGKNMKRGPIYWHFPHYSNHGMQSPGGAIRDGDYKLLEYFENGTVQLFNLRNDIGEQNDLSKIEIEKTKELKDKLHKWREKVGAKMMKPNPDYDSEVKPDEFYKYIKKQ